MENPYSYFSTSLHKKQLGRCIYLAPEDVTGKLSGGHIEAITDAYFLSYIFSEVILAHPILASSGSSNDLLSYVLAERKNIRVESVMTKSSLLQILFLSTRRLDFTELNRNINTNSKDIFILGCHRNLLAQIELSLCHGCDNLYFKSYGTIFLHNLSNIKSVILTNFIDKLFLKRLISTFFYMIFENISFILCKKAFMTRHKENVINNFFGKIFHIIFNKKLVYSASGPFWFFTRKKINNKIIPIKKKPCNKILIGSLGDNTFPTSIIGLKTLINKLSKSNEHKNLEIDIKVAGKSNRYVEKILKNSLIHNKKINIEFLGYINNKEEFYKSLDALLVPVSGGSAMPIKALESVINYSGPVLVTKYIYESCSALIANRNNVYYNSSIFLSNCTNHGK